MSSFRSLLETASQIAPSIQKQASSAWDKFQQDINLVQLPILNQDAQQQENLKWKDESQEKFEGLDQLDLLQSRAVENENDSKSSNNHEKDKKKRVREIEEQKKQIAEQLRKLNDEIDEIKGKNQNQNNFKKRQKIHRDESAAKNAQKLVKDLKMQRKEIQNKRRRDQEKQLKQLQRQQQERRKHREEEALRIKQQKRIAIIQRMEQEKKRKQERRIIQQQSNHLITKLKKEQKLEKQVSIVPSQIFEVQNKQKALGKKNNNFDLQEIQQHDRKYRQIKMKAKRQKQQRSQSMKVQKNAYFHKYQRNIWIEKLEEEEQRRKEQQKRNQQSKKKQLQKRLKYGQLVKNIFIPKKREKSKDFKVQDEQINLQQYKQNDQKDQQKRSIKPRTPQDISSLPKIKSSSKNNTQNSKMYRQESLPGIKNSKNFAQKPIKQFDPDKQEKERLRKIRQQELRKETNERLKKLQNQNLNKAQVGEKVKYENYLGKVKVKKQNGNEWKKIMDNTKLTDQEKYRQLMKKAGDLQAKAKIKQDKNSYKDADQDAVNLYIGSIQAKLALLEKF